MSRAHRTRAALAAAVLAALVLPLTACSQTQRTIDCASLAAGVANDLSNLKSVINDPQSAGNALQSLQHRLSKAADNLDSQDAKDAANGLSDMATQLSTKVANGQGLTLGDLEPLASGAAHLTKVCAS